MEQTSNQTVTVNYLDDSGLSLLYSRLNKRFIVVDALPEAESIEPSGMNLLYVLRTGEGASAKYFPYVLESGQWASVGISADLLDSKADRVIGSTDGHVATLDKDGNIADSGMPAGTFVALTADGKEYGNATDLRKIWSSYMCGMPVMLLDNRESGLYASLNEIGYLWVEGSEIKIRHVSLDDNNSPYDDSIHGYYDVEDGRFYEDPEHTVEIEGNPANIYLDVTANKVYRFTGEFLLVHRFVQFATTELPPADDPVWENRLELRAIHFRMVEPVQGWSPAEFTVVKSETTSGDVAKKADKVIGAVAGNFAGLDNIGNLTDSGKSISEFISSTEVEAEIERLEDLIGNLGGFEVVESGPDGKPLVDSPSYKTIYLTKDGDASLDDRYNEWIYTLQDDWDKIGATSVDLSNYYTKDETDTLLSGKQDEIQDLDTIRSGASAGLTAYQKPAGGIPSSDMTESVQQAIGLASTAVQQEPGKGLSTNDYTTAEKNKLGTVEEGAEVNVIVGVSVSGTVIQPGQDRVVDLPLFDGSSAGLVPGATQQDAGKYLTADGTWAAFNFATIEDIDNMFTEPSDKVRIGGHEYTTVQIGNRLWLKENLDYSWNGLITVPESTYERPIACYYDNDESTYGWDGQRKGLLYNYAAIETLRSEHAEALNGWRVPNIEDFVDLINVEEDQNLRGYRLKSTSGWVDDGNGDDKFGFEGRPVGSWNRYDGQFGGVDSVVDYWSTTEYDGGYYCLKLYGFDPYPGASKNKVYFPNNYGNDFASIRLVKNI